MKIFSERGKSYFDLRISKSMNEEKTNGKKLAFVGNINIYGSKDCF